ncbi:MAG TPA: hypothetical protein VNJ07_06315 [Chitinophagales bacterium]|nr:hypothetical protein [Chitinophagales bacterium]
MKNQKLNTVLGICAIFIFAFSSCRENEHHDNHAVITISSPPEGAVFHPGDTVRIDVTAIGELELHGLDVHIVNLSANDTVYSIVEHAHNDSIEVHEFWIADVMVASSMRLIATVILDHDNNVEAASVDFQCMP